MIYKYHKNKNNKDLKLSILNKPTLIRKILNLI